MSSVGIPDPSPPFNPFRDCSQELCSIYCPQWCYILYPPPPPLFGLDDSGDSGTYFSPLIVAVIGILASAFILVTYYAIISKYCRRRSDGDGGLGLAESFENDRVINETRQYGSQPGLDESLIKSISVYKFKKTDGLIEEADCSVCLSEFEENEHLRLLPKCSHAFHLTCIDTWLKTNSSCPLCRCNISPENPTLNETTVSAHSYQLGGDATVIVIEDSPDNTTQEAVIVEIINDEPPRNQDQTASSDEIYGRIETGEEVIQSDSMESTPVDGDGVEVEVEAVVSDSSSMGIVMGASSNGGEVKDHGKSRNRNGILNSGMKKSIASVFTKYGKGRIPNLPN